jgi:hypothetical protein
MAAVMGLLRSRWTVGLSLALSFVLHVLFVVVVKGWWDEERDIEAFKARLAQIPRFEPPRLLVGKPRSMPERQMEYLAAEDSPAEFSDLPPEAPRPEAIVVPDAPDRLREFEIAAKADTFALPETQRPSLAQMPTLGLEMDQEQMDLLRIEDMARANKEHALVVPDPVSRRDLRGYVNFTRLRLYGGGSDKQGVLDDLARYVRDHTHVLARAEGAAYEYFLSEELLKDPVHFLFEGGGLYPFKDGIYTDFSEEEKQLLGRYLRGGGFLFVEGGYRYLGEMRNQLRSILGNEGRIFPVPPTHDLYHSFYDFDGGFAGEDKGNMQEDLPGSPWYYPVGSRQDEVVVNTQSFSLAAQQEEQIEELPAMGIWGVEFDGELVAVLSDLNMHSQWRINEDANQGNTNTVPVIQYLQAGTNIVVYALTRGRSLTPKLDQPAWIKRRPQAPSVPLAGDLFYDSENQVLDQDLLGDLDASLALVHSPFGDAIGQGGIKVSINGGYSLDLLKQGVHGLLFRNMPAGEHWIEVEFGGKSRQMEIDLQGGKVSTVTFGLNRYAFISQLRMKTQEDAVGLGAWRLSFGDLWIEEVFLLDDRGAVE